VPDNDTYYACVATRGASVEDNPKADANLPINLDPGELLGLSQVAKVSAAHTNSAAHTKLTLGTVLNKIGPEGPVPTSPMRPSLPSRSLSKIDSLSSK